MLKKDTPQKPGSAGWARKELKKRSFETLFISLFTCADAMGIGMILAGFFRYGSYSFSMTILIFLLTLMLISLLKMLVHVLVESNWLWEKVKGTYSDKKGEPDEEN